jgi:hypothetical protein
MEANLAVTAGDRAGRRVGSEAVRIERKKLASSRMKKIEWALLECNVGFIIHLPT